MKWRGISVNTERQETSAIQALKHQNVIYARSHFPSAAIKASSSGSPSSKTNKRVETRGEMSERRILVRNNCKMQRLVAEAGESENKIWPQNFAF